MVCKINTNEEGEMTSIVCSAPWGMGVTHYPGEVDEYSYIYGFGGRGDPHDFEPDFESNTPDEIKAWKDAKAACKCGREL